MAASKAKPKTVKVKVNEGVSLDMGVDPKIEERILAKPGDIVTFDQDEAERLERKGFVTPYDDKPAREIDASSSAKTGSGKTTPKSETPPPLKGENETVTDGAVQPADGKTQPSLA